MADFNKVIVIGRLTKDPNVVKNKTGDGSTVFINLAVNRRYNDAAGKPVEETTFLDNVICFGKVGENIAKFFKKGRAILIEGRLNTRKDEESKGNKTGIIVENWTFVDSNTPAAAETN